MHFGMFFHFSVALAVLSSTEKSSRKNTTKFFIALSLSPLWECLRHRLNDQWDDNSLKTREKDAWWRATSHKLVRKLLQLISFHIQISFLSLSLMERQKSDFWPQLFLTTKTEFCVVKMRAGLKKEENMFMLLCTRAVRRFIFIVIYYEMFDMETYINVNF